MTTALEPLDSEVAARARWADPNFYNTELAARIVGLEQAVGGTAGGTIADPGDGLAIPVTTTGSVALTSGGSGETRTLAVPDFVRQRLTISMTVNGGGDIVLTVASAIDQAGSTIVTFGDAGDLVELVAMTLGAVLAWRVVANNGCALT